MFHHNIWILSQHESSSRAIGFKNYAAYVCEYIQTSFPVALQLNFSTYNWTPQHIDRKN